MSKRVLSLFLLCPFVLFLIYVAQPAGSASGLMFVDSGQSIGTGASFGVALGDVDGDTDLDAFIIRNAPNEVWINQGGAQGGTPGVFADSGQRLGSFSYDGVALGDLDGDGDLDAFVTRVTANPDANQVWINQGGDQGGTEGEFVNTGQVMSDGAGREVVLADVDDDNDLDAYIVRANVADQLWLNNGTGTFSNSGQNLNARDATGAVLADFDGDNDLDIFTANSDTVSTVWVNQGNLQGGTLGVYLDSGQILTHTTASSGVDAGDVDGDGDQDAYVINTGQDTLWLNNGSGQFTASGQILDAQPGQDVTLQDLDGDNDLDVALGNFGGNSVWLNQGGQQGGTQGIFQSTGQAIGTGLTYQLGVGDVDGDSDPDLFSADFNGPDRVFLNQSAGGPTPTSTATATVSPTPPPVQPAGWQIQLLESRGQTGFNPDIALDSNDYPHIAYFSRRANGSIEYLHYQYWDGVRWHDEIVLSGQLSESVAIGLDNNDRPHLVFVTGSSELSHAYWNGTQWEIQMIPSGDVTGNVDLAIDSQDQPHVTFAVTQPTDAFQYAAWDGTAWQIETFATVDFSFGSFTSLALDGNDRPHIAYMDELANTLKYAHHDGNNWQTNTIHTAGQLSIFDPFFSLALDGNLPVVAFYAEFGETLHYAQWDGNIWQTQTVGSFSFPAQANGSVSLAMDSTNNPHISYAFQPTAGVDISLRYVYWDGGQWQNEILDNSGTLGEQNAMAMDASDNPHIAYHEATFEDLRYITWGPNWQTRSLPSSNQVSAVDVQVQRRMPYLGYHNLSNNLVNLTRWDDSWEDTPADSVTNPIFQVSLLKSTNFQHLSYYDADAQVLQYGRYNEFGWQLQTVDSSGDTGRYNQLVIPGAMDSAVYIAYWDETLRRVKLGIYDVYSDTFQLHTNTASPNLPAGSGPLSATMLPDGNVGIVYYDAGGNDLRFAVWVDATASWTDELVAGGGDVGRLNALQTDAVCGCPVVAYYDETNDAIRYGYKDGGSWQIETVVQPAGGVTGLDLELGLMDRERPRLTYNTSNQSHFAQKVNGVWQLETIATGLNNLGQTALTLDGRAHIAYGDALSGVQYIFRSATLDVDTSVSSPPQPGGGYNGLSPCPAIIDFFISNDAGTNSPMSPAVPSAAVGPLDDVGVFQNMTTVFAATNGGQYYIDQYFTHATELGQIGRDDLELMWDGFGTLQNFLPGLEGLVTGNGSDFVVTQAMVDDALDVWTRIAAVASSDLANVINTELAQSNNLQDFVGLTFDEWAIAIGVHPPSNDIYLPFAIGGAGTTSSVAEDGTSDVSWPMTSLLFMLIPVPLLVYRRRWQ